MRWYSPFHAWGPALLALAACNQSNGTGPAAVPFGVDSTRPASAALDVEVGTTLQAYFSHSLNPSTLSDATFAISTGGTFLPRAVTYDGAHKAARLAGPFLPGQTYEATLFTGIQDAAGTPLPAAQSWSFTTRTWQALAVDEGGDVGRDPSLAVDANGRVHVTYYDGTNRDLKYATCAATCATSANWAMLAVDQTGDVGAHTSLAVDATGRLHVGYDDATNGNLKYATCAASCTSVANWKTITVDPSGFVAEPSLAVDAGGRVHVAYLHAFGFLMYATCAASCTTAANWQAAVPDASGNVGGGVSLAVDAGGRVHVSYNDAVNGDLDYATCAANCTTTANWASVAVDQPGDVGAMTALAVDATGRVHVGYWDSTNGDLKYATCVSSCGTAANWKLLAVDESGTVGSAPSLAVDASERVFVSYYAYGSSGALKYTTCAANCAAAASWQLVFADQAGSVGAGSSLAVDRHGAVHIGYYDLGNGDLKYVR